MRLTALVDSFAHVCCRYRLAAFQPFLERAGHQLDLEPIPRHWWSRLLLFRKLSAVDAVILQRRLLQPWQLHLLRRAARVLIYDFDDAVFLRDSYASKGSRSIARERRFATIVRAADAVVSGNDFLNHQAQAQLPRRNNVVIPTCVDPSLYDPARHRRVDAGVQLVWIGSGSTLHGLEAIKPILEHLGRQWPSLQLKVICDRFLYLEHLPVVNCPWTEVDEAADLAAADIGISWLPDDAWSRGKCGLKILQYMVAGLPVVANPVGVQSELVTHGVTGFLVETAADWSQVVQRLAHDPALRQRMGEAGRRRVEAEFSVAVGAQRWLNLLERLARRSEAA